MNPMGPAGAAPDLLAVALVGTARHPRVPQTLVEEGTPDAAAAYCADPSAANADPDPASRLLDLAARRRVLRLLTPVARARPIADRPGASPLEPCPAPTARWAPQAAVTLLARFLMRGERFRVSCWLRAAVRHGRTVPPVLWTPLAEAAASSIVIDPTTAAAALGEQGRWFVRHNPSWRRLDVTGPSGPGPSAATAPDWLAAGGVPQELGAIHQVLTRDGPYPDAVVDAALGEAASGRLRGAEGRRLSVALGRRLPLTAYSRLPIVLERVLSTGKRVDETTALAAQEAVSTVERELFGRWEIEAAFDSQLHGERVRLPDRSAWSGRGRG